MSVVTESRGFVDFYNKPGTLSGAKIAIILNELGLDYQVHEVHDKDPHHTISPNNHFPVITDVHPDGFKVHLNQTGAIAQYLVKEYDEDHAISFPERSTEEVEATNWFFFGVSRIAPSHEEAVHYGKEAPERLPYSIDRSKDKISGLFLALNSRLEKTGDYLVGHKFSIADIAQIPYVVAADKAGINIEDFSFLISWYEKVLSRSGVKRGLSAAGIEYST